MNEMHSRGMAFGVAIMGLFILLAWEIDEHPDRAIFLMFGAFLGAICNANRPGAR